jgi:acetyl esterase/lipase
MKRIAMIALLFAAIPSAEAQQAAQPPFERLYQMPLVYTVPGVEKVEVRRDIAYKSIHWKEGKVALKLDAYLPADGKPHPVVVLISGGGIEGAPYDFRDAGVYQSYGRVLGASGFVAITYSKRYARGPEGTSKGAEDTRDMIAYVREHSEALRIDKDSMALWAFSAGGLMLAPFLRETAAYVRGIVCFYCVSDVTENSWSGVEGVKQEQVERAAAEYSSANAVHAADHAFPPILVGRAGLDSPQLNETIDRLMREALAKNLSIELWNHPTGRHAFDILDDNARSREIIRRAIEFLRTNLNSKP